jgi:hypothetical protein
MVQSKLYPVICLEGPYQVSGYTTHISMEKPTLKLIKILLCNYHTYTFIRNRLVDVIESVNENN